MVNNIEDLQANLEKVLIPNVFTPNQDGVNDQFEIKGFNLAGDFVTEFTIFDRFGSEVLKSEDLNFGWDGTMQNTGIGSEVETDTYFYLISITDQNSGETATRTGFIELRR